jgi:RNA polymerase sigma-70 factor (ECF subfamily)
MEEMPSRGGAEPMPDRATDDELMARIAKGDEEAFRELVLRWEDRVFAFCLRSLGSRGDAEDLSQETFIRVYRSARRYRPRGRFTAWLFRIAGNLCRNAIRRQRPAHEITTDLPAPETDRPDITLQRKEFARAVREAVACLPDRQRIAVVLRRYEGFSYQEIAEALDTTVSAVESLLHRASERLRQELHDLPPP